MKLTKSNVEDLKYILEDYLLTFKENKAHQKILKKEPCYECGLAKGLLRKLKYGK